MRLGLHFIDQGVRGVVVETSPVEFEPARARHEELQALTDGLDGGQAGCVLVLRLIAEGVVLHPTTLHAAVSAGTATLYRSPRGMELELDTGGGWRDRRILPGAVVRAIQANRGVAVSGRELQLAAKAIASLPGYAGLAQPLNQAIADAQAWWHGWLGGPLFSHVSRLRPWQPLSRAARARVLTGRPQLDTARKIDRDDERLVQAVESNFHRSGELGFVARLRKRFGEIVAEKGGTEHGRGKMLDALEWELPAALRAGRAQTMLVAGTHYVIRHGGIKGKLLAPRSISDYFSKHIAQLGKELLRLGTAERSGWDWLDTYRAMLKSAEETQRGKLAAFLEAFHRFLVLTGVEPLPAGILANSSPRPPAAAVVTERELNLALRFVLDNAETERLASQCSVVLLLGWEVELRTYEPWCLRLVDIQLEGAPYLVVYPRPGDGVGKSPALRRTVDLKGPRLIKMLSAVKGHRLRVDHADEDDDLLLGEPGVVGERHEHEKTMRLVNAALRWATGWSRASFYDLRHTVFSRKVDRVMREGMGARNDVAALHQISAEGGHAGPGSSWPYIHWFEEALEQAGKKARPSSWAPADPHEPDSVLFPEIGSGVLGEARGQPPKSSRRGPLDDGARSTTLAQRFDIAVRLTKGTPVAAVAGRCQLGEEVVLRCLRSLVTALVDADLATEEDLSTVSRQVQVLVGLRGLVAAAAHAKWKPVRQALDRLDLEIRDAAARELWHAWTRCRQGDHLDMERARPAGVLLDFLLKAGIPRKVMAITAAQAALPLPQHLKQQNLAWRRGSARPGVPRYRLILVPHHASASQGRARQVSMRGLHFWMVLLRSAILEKEKEK